jgi:hypothetical protein
MKIKQGTGNSADVMNVLALCESPKDHRSLLEDVKRK